MNNRILAQLPRCRRAIMTANSLCTSGVALLLALSAAHVQGQPASPLITLQRIAGNTNLLFQLATQPGWFYTFQQSTSLTYWTYATNYYADGTPLSWTNSMSPTNKGNYFRVSVNPPNPIAYTNYHGWGNSITVNNGMVEAVIVPAIGRVLQFRFLGDTNNAFWEDPTLYGKYPTSNAYQGWGGDKAWPAAQNSWNPTWPPSDFDRMTNAVSFTNGVVTNMTIVADSRFGIRITRIVELLYNEPVMRIRTIFVRTATPSPTSLLTSNLAVWIDCQANVSMSSRCYVPIPSPSIFATNYTTTGDAFFGPAFTTNFTSANGLISFGPDSARSHKLGFDSGILVLVGTNISLRVEAPRVPGATYTAGGCNTEVYTGQYPGSPFFELELQSPAPILAVGDTIEFVTTYSLFRRTGTTTDEEAQKVLSWQY